MGVLHFPSESKYGRTTSMPKKVKSNENRYTFREMSTNSEASRICLGFVMESYIPLRGFHYTQLRGSVRPNKEMKHLSAHHALSLS